MSAALELAFREWTDDVTDLSRADKLLGEMSEKMMLFCSLTHPTLTLVWNRKSELHVRWMEAKKQAHNNAVAAASSSTVRTEPQAVQEPGGRTGGWTCSKCGHEHNYWHAQRCHACKVSWNDQ